MQIFDLQEGENKNLKLHLASVRELRQLTSGLVECNPGFRICLRDLQIERLAVIALPRMLSMISVQ